MQIQTREEKQNTLEVCRLIDANYELIKYNITKKEVLRDIFEADLILKLNYKPERLFDFTELKTTILRNIPNIERGISLIEQYYRKLEKHFSFLSLESNFRKHKLFDIFLRTHMGQISFVIPSL